MTYSCRISSAIIKMMADCEPPGRVEERTGTRAEKFLCRHALAPWQIIYEVNFLLMLAVLSSKAAKRHSH